MKVDIDKKLIKYGIYITVFAVVIYGSFQVVSNLGEIVGWFLRQIISLLVLIKPLIYGIIIAYLLYPMTQWIESILKENKIYVLKKKSNRRIVSIFASYIFVAGLIIGLLVGVYFMIGGQLSKNTTLISISDEVINYVKNTSLDISSLKSAIDKLNITFLHSLEPYLVNIASYLQQYIINNISNMSSYIISVGSTIVTFLISMVISIYLLMDSEYFINLWKKLYFIIFRNKKIGKKITEVFSILHEVFSKFIRGQLLEAICVGILSSIVLTIVGIDYAPVIGIISGICNMIPYVGPIAGTILAATIGLLSDNPVKVIYAIIAMIIVQQLDNNLLAPKIVGESVGLHPVFTMMAILVGGNIGGLFGMLLAVPILASIKVIINRWYNTKFNQEQ
ncbi:MAG: AI-2E family transporter [Clostridiaceae bacterium]|nr:AI-2E family transporter [Clostridiaceae bacterium]